MDMTVQMGDFEKRLLLLRAEQAAASRRALTAINEHGVQSEAFRTADRELQALRKRIEALTEFHSGR
jgi:hypothetical protein